MRLAALLGLASMIGCATIDPGSDGQISALNEDSTVCHAWENAGRCQRVDTYNEVVADILGFDLSRDAVRVVNPAFEVNSTSELSLLEFGEKLPRSSVALSAGLSGRTSEGKIEPAGLLVSDDKVYATKVSNPDQASKLNGILCLSKNAGWKILPSDEYKAGMCHQAVQAGPVLVTNGVVAKDLSSARKETRLAICLHGTKLKVILTRTPSDAASLATWAASKENGGLDCEAAIVVASGATAGVDVTEPYGHSYLGDVAESIASALVIAPISTKTK